MSTPVGGYILAADPIEINAGRPRLKLAVRNTGDRPVQVASHFHFFEVNRALEFDRVQARCRSRTAWTCRWPSTPTP